MGRCGNNVPIAHKVVFRFFSPVCASTECTLAFIDWRVYNDAAIGQILLHYTVRVSVSTYAIAVVKLTWVKLDH